MLGYATGQRVDALDARIETLDGRLDEVMVRLDRLVGDLGRLAAGLDQVQQRVGTQVADQRGQVSRLSAVRHEIAYLREQGRSVAGLVADLHAGSIATAHDIAELRADGRTAADRAADQASRSESLREEGRRHERSLDQVRADITRIEQQAAADLTRLRAADTALARVMLGADGVRRGPGTPATGRGEEAGHEPALVSSGRLDEASDELAAPEPATVPIVEEEPAERQASQ